MLLDIENLSKIYGDPCGGCIALTGDEHGSALCPCCDAVVAVNRIDLRVEDNEVLGIVGESGSGKSTLLQLIYGDAPATAGKIFFREMVGEQGELTDILSLNMMETVWMRNTMMAMIYQNPRLGLNFLFSGGGNIAEKVIGAGERSFASIRKTACHYFEKTDLPVSRIDQCPDAFSGGQQQRIQISKALAASPRLLLLDEPTTGLDVSVQARILDMIRSLQKEMSFAMIVVSHDLGVIRHLTDITVVMRNGSIVERGLTDQVLEDPQHAYTQLLVSSVL